MARNAIAFRLLGLHRYLWDPTALLDGLEPGGEHLEGAEVGAISAGTGGAALAQWV